MTLFEEIKRIAKVDLFEREASTGSPATGRFIGRPFYLDYERAYLLVADAWKHSAGGVPQGCFLLAYYDAEDDVREAVLLRVLHPAKLPTDSDVISSMVEYYKDNLKTSGKTTQLDSYTRYEFSFSGLECRTLGTFYRNEKGQTEFGADVENFFSAHNYSVVKPHADVLEAIVNFREGEITGGPSDIKIGRVRYSSTRRFQDEPEVPVFVAPRDFLGTRTALFGMTRTGKSNTVKKVIQATVAMSEKAPERLEPGNGKKHGDAANLLDPFTKERLPKYPVGQIIFDINGEYANANLQDEGTAIFEIFAKQTTRYSVIPKSGFKVMKVNFYRDIESGFELLRSLLREETGDYIRSFLSVDFTKPSDYATEASARVRYDRRVAAYLCCLYRAGFAVPDGLKVSFVGAKEINQIVQGGKCDPKEGLSLEEASNWWETIWEAYDSHPYFTKYRAEKGREWADDDLKSILAVLTRKKQPGGTASVSGYIKLRPISSLHTHTVGKPFEQEIVEELGLGHIVIVDLSQGDPDLQRLYSERICRGIFANAMGRFIENKPNNFVQFYFEEAHNLFPKRDDKDLSQIYNRIAKEGAKLHLGLIYATQEVSSISANILKNTQNWFIAHLNNEDETKELRKYYDFTDFSESLVRFSASTDKGFVRMKTYSNPFVVPVQVGRFSATDV
jgi:DNA helicase HerA-like ATPase